MKLGECLASIMMGNHTYSNDIRIALIKDERDLRECIKLSNNLLFRDLYAFTHFFWENWLFLQGILFLGEEKAKIQVLMYILYL